MTDPLANATGSRPATSAGARAFTVRPFQRLARTHVANCMADAMLAAALADSLFFSLPADSARSPVVRYLIITMLPFAVIAPLVGPMIDRLKGGHRFVLIGSTVLRVVLCWLMIDEIKAGGPSFFLLALCVLVCQRAYNVARSALVPTVVGSDDELIEANSKLAIIGGVSGFVGILPAAVLLKLWGPGWALGLAMLTYSMSALLGLRIPRSRVAAAKADSVEKSELRGVGIVLAGSAMGLLRMCVGFLTMLIAFDFRGGDRPPWQFGVVAGVSVLAGLAGAGVAPRLKEHATEETILTASLGLVVTGAFFALFVGEVLGACLVGVAVGFAAALGKLAFDSILQRDAPDANRGRSFARFETRFQVSYVLGSFIPVAVKTGAKVGFAVLLAVAVFATVSYVIGRLAWAHRTGERQNKATAAAVVVEERMAEVTGEVKGRLAAAPRNVYNRLRGDDPDDPGGPGGPGDTDASLGSGGPDGVSRSSPMSGVDPTAALVDQPDRTTTIDADGPTVAAAPTDRDATEVSGAPTTELFDQDLAPTSPVAWTPPPTPTRSTTARPPVDQGELPWPGSGPDDPTQPVEPGQA